MLQNIVSDCTVRIFCTVLYIHILNAKSVGSEHSTPSSLSHLLKSLFLGFNNEVQMEPPKVRAQSEVFQGREGFGELGHFDKYFVKNLSKKAPQRKILEFFLLDTIKTTFWMEILTQRWTLSGPFFPKIRALFMIFKKGRGGLSPSPPFCTPERRSIKKVALKHFAIFAEKHLCWRF